jgi:hypothetical protein
MKAADGGNLTETVNDFDEMNEIETVHKAVEASRLDPANKSWMKSDKRNKMEIVKRTQLNRNCERRGWRKCI